MLRAFIGLFRLELKKQRKAFHALLILTACLSVVLLALLVARGVKDLDELLSGVTSIVGVCAFLAAIYFGISSGRGLTIQTSRDVEDDLPAPPAARVLGAYASGVAYLGVFLFMLSVLAILLPQDLFLPGIVADLPSGEFIWIVTSLLKLELFSFVAGCCIPMPVLGAFLSVLAALVDAFCSLTLIRAHTFFSATSAVYDTSSYLLPARLLVDVLLLILSLSIAALVTSPGNSKTVSVLFRKLILPGFCLLFGPVASWLVFLFLMTPAMHAEFKWSFLPAVFFEAARSLGFL